MSLLFGQKTGDAYDAWYRSPQGRIFDSSLAAALFRFLDPMPGDRVLDIGCGSGNHLLLLNRLGLHISGVDGSPHMIERAKERLGNACPLKIGMAEDLPFDDNEFDYATLIHTLEFLDDPLPALREAGRVSRKKVLVGVMNTLSCNAIKRKIQGYFGDPLFRHTRFFTLWEITSSLRNAYGTVPLSWDCTPPIMGKSSGDSARQKAFFPRKNLPFASFLLVSATLRYTVKTQNLPLKARLKDARHGVLGAKAFQELRFAQSNISPKQRDLIIDYAASNPGEMLFHPGESPFQQRMYGIFLDRFPGAERGWLQGPKGPPPEEEAY
jgi:SAM-dependent methyltransferase